MKMVSTKAWLSFLFWCGVACVTAFGQDSRATLFNSGWRFQLGDVAQGEKVSTSDQQWRSLDLPHDWSIEGPFSEEWASGTGYLPTGIGWYRKTFELVPAQRNKTVYLYFDGVYMNGEVWINEHYLGKRPNGYASFFYDITEYLKPDGKNLVAVKVDHTDFADSRWYTGSGINRNVYLVAVNDVHTDIWGVTFTTPRVSAEQAEAKVVVSIKNKTSKSTAVNVTTELIDAKGHVVSKAETSVTTEAKKNTDATLSFTVKNPALWSPDSPSLYQLRTTLAVKNKTQDVITEQVGFRSFRFDADKGFFLNDKNIKLKGLCIHDDAGALGSAVPRDVWERRLKAFKDMGCNSIRMSHNPHQDYLYDLCDRMGFLVQDEAFDEWETGKNKWIKGWNVGTPGKDGYSKYFREWAERDLRDMILRNRNRTCVIMWSIGNEIDYPNDPYTHEILNTGRNPQIYGKGYQAGFPEAKRLGEISKRLVQVVKQYDTTRPVTAALAGVVMSNLTDYPASLDLVGYNYQEYRYADDHRQYPKRVIYGSENGKSYGAWQPVDSLEYISAQYLWTGIDFMGEARAWPVRSSGAGLLDLAGNAKSEFYYRKSLWSDTPTLHLGISKFSKGKNSWSTLSHWNWTAGDSLTVSCYTNQEEAELFINGRSQGRKLRKDAYGKMLSWKVVYEAGEVTVKSYQQKNLSGQYSIKTAQAASVLAVTSDRTTLAANSDAVAHIDVQVMDDAGTRVALSENEIEVNISGPGKLIGLENGNLSSHEDYKASKRKAYHGKLLAYVQATKPGTITITVSSPGLKSKTITLTSK